MVGMPSNKACLKKYIMSRESEFHCLGGEMTGEGVE